MPEAAGSIADIDEAMRLGYAWRWGPFELADKVGVAWLVVVRGNDRAQAFYAKQGWVDEGVAICVPPGP